MSISWFVLLSCLVAIAKAQDFDGGKCQIKPCCVPKKWEGYQAPMGGVVIHGRPGMVAGITEVHYDAVNKMKMSRSNMTLEGHYVSVKSVLKNKTLYVVDMLRNKCYKKKWRRPFREMCIPKTAKCSGHFYYGSGNNKIEGDTYFVDVHGPRRTNLKVFGSVTKNCIPLGAAFFGRIRGMPIEETVGFFNIKVGIKDPSVFDVPKQCKDGTFEMFSPESEAKEYQIFGF